MNDKDAFRREAAAIAIALVKHNPSEGQHEDYENVEDDGADWPCQCCGALVIEGPHDICCVCDWQYDTEILNGHSFANHMLLEDAQAVWAAVVAGEPVKPRPN